MEIKEIRWDKPRKNIYRSEDLPLIGFFEIEPNENAFPTGKKWKLSIVETINKKNIYSLGDNVELLKYIAKDHVKEKYSGVADRLLPFKHDIMVDRKILELAGDPVLFLAMELQQFVPGLTIKIIEENEK